MAYSDKVIDHYSNPRNVGTLDKSKKSVGTGLVGAPECGDVMRLQIEVDETTNTITDAIWQSVTGGGDGIDGDDSANEYRYGVMQVFSRIMRIGDERDRPMPHERQRVSHVAKYAHSS